MLEDFELKKVVNFGFWVVNFFLEQVSKSLYNFLAYSQNWVKSCIIYTKMKKMTKSEKMPKMLGRLKRILVCGNFKFTQIENDSTS